MSMKSGKGEPGMALAHDIVACQCHSTNWGEPERVVCRVGDHQHQLAHQCSPNIRNWDMGMGHLWLNEWGIYDLMGGAFIT